MKTMPWINFILIVFKYLFSAFLSVCMHVCIACMRLGVCTQMQVEARR